MSYDWDEEKAALNEVNHGVSFSEAATVFKDDYCLILPDVWHSQIEERFVALGESQTKKLLVVIYTLRDGTIRIISARAATLNERKKYVKENQV